MDRRLIFALALAISITLVDGASSRELTDAAGRKVRLPEHPARVISLAPGITEMLYALDAGDLLVGVTEQCDRPPAARAKPKIGGMVNPSIEAIVALQPDVVIATMDGNRPGDVDSLARLGLAVWVIDTRSLGGVREAMTSIGEVVNRSTRSRELADQLAATEDGIARAVRNAAKPSVLLLLGRQPLVAAGPGSYLDDMLHAAGGVNALRKSPLRYPLLAMETLMAADPDVVIIADMAMTGGTAEAPAPGWERLRAVREQRVHHLADDALLRPGPRTAEALQGLAALVHPDLFPAGSR